MATGEDVPADETAVSTDDAAAPDSPDSGEQCDFCGRPGHTSEGCARLAKFQGKPPPRASGNRGKSADTQKTRRATATEDAVPKKTLAVETPVVTSENQKAGSCWQLMAVCQFLNMVKSANRCRFPESSEQSAGFGSTKRGVCSPADLEAAIERPMESYILAEVMSHLLVPDLKEGHSFGYNEWNHLLNMTIQHHWYAADEEGDPFDDDHGGVFDPKAFGLPSTNPLLLGDFGKLSLTMRIVLLKALCEWKMDNCEKLRDALMQADPELQRMSSVGADSMGQCYWRCEWFKDARVYRECAAKTGKKRSALDVTLGSFELFSDASSVAKLRKLLKTTKASKKKKDKQMVPALERCVEEGAEVEEAVQRQKEKAELAQMKAIERRLMEVKRSSRLAHVEAARAVEEAEANFTALEEREKQDRHIRQQFVRAEYDLHHALIRDQPHLTVLCDGECGGEFHIHALRPPKSEVPEDEFYCVRCAKERKSAEEGMVLDFGNIEQMMRKKYVGEFIRKKFYKHGEPMFFFGEVMSYSGDAHAFHVLYEDKDTEELKPSEIEQCLVKNSSGITSFA